MYMSSLFCAKTHRPIALHQKLASSGEGDVWTTGNPKQLAKIYHRPTHQRQQKLQVMIDHPPKLPSLNQGFISFAWPQSLLMNGAPHSGSLGDRQIVGFLMPRIEGGRELIDVYNPSRRKRLGIKVNWHFLHVVAHNIASLIETLHRQDMVLGDLKPQNILINNQAIPAIIDTDSFQIKDPTTGAPYRCLVGSEGFTPPELTGLDFSLVTQNPLHDRFRLGVIVYYLLFGSHPFQGHWSGTGDPPDLQALIEQGQWIFSPHSLLRPSQLTIPLDIIHPELQACFWRCFQEGHRNPSQRPSAAEWQQALATAAAELKPCLTVKSHVYHSQEPSCYWCDRHERMQTDIFDHTVAPATLPKPIPPVSPPIVSVPPLPAKNPAPSPWLFVPAQKGNTYQFQLAFFPSLLLWLTGGAITAWIIPAILGVGQHNFRQAPVVSSAPVAIEPSLVPAQKTQPEPSPTPLRPENLLKTGYGNYIQGDYAQALQELTQALAIDPNLAEAYYYRSLVLQTLGRYPDAALDWQIAQRLAPDQMPFNPMFTSLELALPLSQSHNKKLATNPQEVPSQRFADVVTPTQPTLPPSAMPSADQGLVGLDAEQMERELRRLKSEINREPDPIPLVKPENLPDP